MGSLIQYNQNTSLNFSLFLTMSWTFSSVCNSNLCVFASVFQHGYGYCMRGPEEIQLYFHREYEHQGHCLTTHVALNTYWIQIIITVMMGTRYTGGGMRCCTKSKWLDAVEAKSEFIPYMEPCPAYDPASQHRCNWDHLIHIWYQFLNPGVCVGVKNSPLT